MSLTHNQINQQIKKKPYTTNIVFSGKTINTTIIQHPFTKGSTELVTKMEKMGETQVLENQSKTFPFSCIRKVKRTYV